MLDLCETSCASLTGLTCQSDSCRAGSAVYDEDLEACRHSHADLPDDVLPVRPSPTCHRSISQVPRRGQTLLAKGREREGRPSGGCWRPQRCSPGSNYGHSITMISCNDTVPILLATAFACPILTADMHVRHDLREAYLLRLCEQPTLVPLLHGLELRSEFCSASPVGAVRFAAVRVHEQRGEVSAWGSIASVAGCK